MRCVLIAIFISVLVTSTVQQHGKQIDDCIWEYEDGTRADLNGIGNVDGTARWNNESATVVDHDPGLYTINPCHGFTLGTECTDVTVCRISNLGIPRNIADASSGRMYYSEDDEHVVLEYNHTSPDDPNVTFISRISFQCLGNEDQVIVPGVTSSTSTHVIYQFVLLIACGATIAPPVTSPPPSVSLHPIKTAATPTVTKVTIGPPPGPPSSLTAGGILCIIFVCCVCGYFLIGAFYMCCCSGARGVEIIPHIHFWLDLPNLIVEGFYFLFGCCGKTRMVSSPSQDYDKI